jgi:hypothetical protein
MVNLIIYKLLRVLDMHLYFYIIVIDISRLKGNKS